MNYVEPPSNFTTDEAVANQHYYGMPGSRDGFMVDVRVWSHTSVHFIKHEETIYTIVFDSKNMYKHFPVDDDQWLAILQLIDFTR